MSFKDKVVLVTGASSGIGAAIAIKFANERSKVTIVGRNKMRLEDVAKVCEEHGSKPLVLVADVTNDVDAKRIVTETVKYFGRLDVLINNAGVGDSVSILDDSFMKAFDKVMNTNIRSIAVITNVAAKHLIESKGNIVNISSFAAVNIISARSTPYCTSKAALDHFSKNIAFELSSYGVRVNCVNPGPVKTDIISNMKLTPEAEQRIWKNFIDSTATGKISEPEEVADLVLYLASDKAGSITGVSHLIDNGCTLKSTK